MDFYTQYKKYENDLNYNDDADSNNPVRVVTVGLACNLYFRGGHKQAVRLAIADCFDTFQEIFKDRIQWETTAEGLSNREFRFSTKKTAPKIRDYIATMDKDDQLEWRISGGISSEEASDCYMTTLTIREWEIEVRDPLNWFQFSMPIEAVYGPHGKPNLFKDFVSYCCQKLNPVHGTAGSATILPRERYGWQTEEFDLQGRYFCLDLVSGTFSEIDHTQNAIRTINWLTILGKSLETQARSHKAAWQILQKTPGIGAWRAGNALIISAGTQPNLGPVTDGIPPLYKAVSDALKPIRRTDNRSMHTGSAYGAVHFDKRTSGLWLRRFDEPGIWPPYPNHTEFYKVDEKINEYETPTQIDDSPPLSQFTGDKALPGEVCPKSGEWLAPNLLGETVHVNAGEIMPGEKYNKGGSLVIWYLKNTTSAK